MVEALLDAGAQQKATISGDGDTAMHLAAKLGKNKCLQILCQSADEETLQIQNEAGDTALHTAILEKNFKAAEIIIGKQTDVNAKVRRFVGDFEMIHFFGNLIHTQIHCSYDARVDFQKMIRRLRTLISDKSRLDCKRTDKKFQHASLQNTRDLISKAWILWFNNPS